MKIKHLLYAGILFLILGLVVFVVTLATAPTGYPWKDYMISRPPWIDAGFIESYIERGTSVAVFLWVTGFVLAGFAGFFWSAKRWADA